LKVVLQAHENESKMVGEPTVGFFSTEYSGNMREQEGHWQCTTLRKVPSPRWKRPDLRRGSGRAGSATETNHISRVRWTRRGEVVWIVAGTSTPAGASPSSPV